MREFVFSQINITHLVIGFLALYASYKARRLAMTGRTGYRKMMFLSFAVAVMQFWSAVFAVFLALEVIPSLWFFVLRAVILAAVVLAFVVWIIEMIQETAFAAGRASVAQDAGGAGD